MFRDKQIVELLENVLRELRQIRLAVKCDILKKSHKKSIKEGEIKND